MTETRSCKTCCFFHRIPTQNTGTCHRLPPTYSVCFGNRWPRVRGTGFCTQWSPSGEEQ